MKKKKGGKKAKSGSGEGTKRSDYVAMQVEDEPEEWVTLQLKLVNWTYQNFQCKVRSSTPLFSIKRRILEKHGHVQELHLYKEQVNSENELLNENATLKELGFVGAPKHSPEEAMATIYYDYKPHLNSNPLLLLTPRAHDAQVGNQTL